ncbi:hypothetical protein BOX15_Mlig010350g1 [Macrostomum lignano]|uniref:Prominin n=1 Tax=Macrostomum lignano TaxID=282301 RepID=A0A267GJQ7_9PLAT|nr:hypothetical protein BOX15_Mlig010350g1 [Macrostomum lignano]
MGKIGLPNYDSCKIATKSTTAILCTLVIMLTLLASGIKAAPPKKSSQSTPKEVAPLEKSVQPFYQVTEKFLDFIQPVEKSIVMSEVVSLLLNGSYFKGNMNWLQTSRRFATSMLGYAILISIGILFIVGFVLSGCVLFCCRCCCGKCGGRLRPMEGKRAKCRRVVYGILLTLVTTLMLCGLVLAFISNQLAHNALDNARSDSAPRRFAQGLSGAAAELDAVPQRARNASAKVVGATLSKLNPTVQASVSAMKVALLDKSDLNNQLGKAKSALASLTKARTLSKRLNQSTWSEVASSWSQLNNTLASLRDALKSISDCPAAAEADCRWLQSKLDWLRVSEPAPSRDSKCNLTLPAELTNSNWDSLESLLNNQPAGLVQTAMDALDRDLKAAKSDLNSSANLSQIWSAAESVAANASAYLRQVANSVNAMIINPTNNAEQSVAAVLTAFDLYRYYLCIGLACLALLIVAFYYLGLAFGFCGEPPYEDSRCCNKGVGANLLLTGTGFAFIFGWLIMIFVMAFFVSGAVMDTEVCRHLTGRAGAPGYAAMDSAAEELLSGSSGSLSRYTGRRLFSGLFGDCADAAAAGKPASFASVLNLSELVQPTYLKRRSGQLIDKVASELQAKWPQIANNSFADPNSLLKRLAPLRAAVDQAGGPAGLAAATCAAALTQGPLSYGLDAERLVDSVKQMSKTLAADAASSPAVNSRWSSLADSLPADIHAAVASIADKRNASSGLSDALANANKSGRNVTYQLKDAAARAINDSAVLNASLLVARQNLKAGVDSLIRGALADVLNTAADCAALGANLRQAVRAPCVQLLQPLNGYWAGLGLCLLCLLLALPLACKLANLYRKTSKYQRDYQEPQGKPKRRKTSGSRDKSRNSQQHSGIPGASSSAAAAGVSNRQSQRYSQLPSYAQEAYDY